MRAAHAAIAAAVLLAASAASAVDLPIGNPPVRLGITSTSILGWHTNNRNASSCDDDYGEALERLNLDASWENWVAGLRIDASLYYPRPELTGPEVVVVRCREVELRGRYLNTLTFPGAPGGHLPEKLWAGYNGRVVEVTVGDAYAHFGRGLTLSLRKTDELGLDTTQRGLRVRVNTERFTATALGGLTNINNVDEASGRYAPDPNDGVIGATADVRLLESLRLGANAAMVLFAQPLSTFTLEGGEYQERWLIGGPRIEAPQLTDWLGLYLEGVGQRRMHIDGVNETGFGLYGSATAYLGPTTVLLEAKAYGDLAVVQPRFQHLEFNTVQYTALPTLERVQQPLEHAQRNITGARLRVDWTVTPDVAVYVNHGTFRDFEGYLHPTARGVLPGTIHDPYVGADARFGAHRVHAQAGVRVVMVRGTALRTDAHADLDVVSGLGGGWSIEGRAIHLERSKVEPFAPSAWREGTLQVGVRHRPKYAVSVILDYTTEKGQPAVWYPGASAEWDFTDASTLRLFAGTSRGGLRCVSGVCRNFPPFSGVKGVLTLRY